MFARREHEAVFAFYDPNIEWDATSMGGESANPLPDDLQGIYHGHEGVRTYWRRWLQAWADIEFEVDDVLDAGDDVVALIRNQRQWGRRSGIVTDIRSCTSLTALQRRRLAVGCPPAGATSSQRTTS